MKNLLIFGYLIFSFNSFGQIVIENAENQNVLYRGYSNKLMIGISGSNYDSLKLDSGTITSTTFNGRQGLIIIPGGNSSCTLYALKYNSSSVDTIDTRVFKVRPLPAPELFWGTQSNGEKAGKTNTRLYVKYGSEFFFNSKFQILSWESSVNGKVFSGTGSELSAEFLNAVKNIKGDQTICINVVFKGENEYTGRTSSCWKN